jgi:NADPH:quinone reductase-like Zn-dependent oxidoreductase
MRTARIHRYGPPEVITVEDTDVPVLAQTEVLVQVRAAGVGPWDSWIRSGRSVLPQPLPLTLGADVSGVVRAVGAGVRSLEVGAEVFGATNARFTGGYAEYAAAASAMLAVKPSGVTHLVAASVPVVAVTALQMLFDHAHLVAGQRVLVLGAGGSVGSLAVQLALLAGVEVVATATARSLELVRSLGAQQVVDVSTDRFEEVSGEVDAVIDTVGGELQARSFSVLRPGGVLVSAVSRPDAERALPHEVKAVFMLVDVTTEALTRIGALLRDGRLALRVGHVLPLEEARYAHELLDGIGSRALGKILLNVAVS